VTLRLVAEHGDACNLIGDPTFVAERDRTLAAHCNDLGRDEREIERTVTLTWPIIRDRRDEARRARASILDRQGVDRSTAADLAGTPEDLVELCAAYVDLGYRHIIVGSLAPYDGETLHRFATEVRPQLASTSTTQTVDESTTWPPPDAGSRPVGGIRHPVGPRLSAAGESGGSIPG
jgi:alkanesulfonate monooxygenase SsuD/methylene tetrahydromethanopterin reductase-like flavin-dependent oxidoreductase (luciferase family)